MPGLRGPLVSPPMHMNAQLQVLFTALFARMIYNELVEQGTSYNPRVERIELVERYRQPILAAAVTVPQGQAAKVAAAINEVAANLAGPGPDTVASGNHTRVDDRWYNRILQPGQGLGLSGRPAFFSPDHISNLARSGNAIADRNRR